MPQRGANANASSKSLPEWASGSMDNDMNHLSKVQLRFLGGAQTVTGSKYLLSFEDRKILIDCGLFQGLKELRIKNWDRFPIDPERIDAVVLTHAHIDHSGYIPRLIKEGFRGKIHATPATLELSRILLPDTGYLQEEEADYLNRKRATKHAPALPLFTEADAEASLSHFITHDFEQSFEVAPGLTVRFEYGGHILGAAIAIVEIGGMKIAFSGDLGRQEDLIFFPPKPLPEVDYLVVESTYGDRDHTPLDPLGELARAVNEAYHLGGVILVPTFAVGRSQNLMYMLWRLRKENRIPEMPMYLNSPMAVDATDVFCRYEILHKLTALECHEVSKTFRYVKSVEESKQLNQLKGRALILSASGMATGGRILHHLRAFGPDPRSTIIFAGYQAAGTRGRALLEGQKEIRIHGQMVPIRAQVRALEAMSAHADAVEIMRWLGLSGPTLNPKKVFITHGEKEAAQALRKKLESAFQWACEVPAQDKEFTL